MVCLWPNAHRICICSHSDNMAGFYRVEKSCKVLNIVLFAIDVTAIIFEWERESLVIVALSCCGQKRRNKGSQICPMSNAKAPTQCNGLFLMTKTLSSYSLPTPPLDHQQFVDRLLTVFMRTAWSWTTFGGACHHDFEQKNPAPKWLNFEQYSKYLAWDRNWVFECLSS